MKYLLIIAVFGLVWFQECDSRSANRGNMNRSDVTATSNNLEVKFSVDRAKIRIADDFRATAVFTNRGPDRLKLNTLFLGFAPILLKVQHADGTPVNHTSPPFPPEDDGDEEGYEEDWDDDDEGAWDDDDLIDEDDFDDEEE